MRVGMMAVVTAAGAIGAGSLYGQSLAEVAARTAKKREEEKARKPVAKVYTDSDLRTGTGGSGAVSQMETEAQAEAATAAPAAAGAVPPAGEKPKTEDEERALKQAEWGDKMEKAQAEIALHTENINKAQSALNDISGPLYGGTRTGLINRLEGAKKALAAAQKSLEDLQEE